MKRITGIFIILCMVFTMAVPTFAETFRGADDWLVRFTQEEKMVSNFKSSDMDDSLNSLQPGDNAIFTVKLKNEHNKKTEWYMSNKVLYSMEDRSANSNTEGGAYTYRLVYKNPSGKENVLFDSDTVGGEDVSNAGRGLHEATDALKDFFYLDKLSKGQTGTITLEVALDGETQGNDYQDTLADLQMNFAVFLDDETTTTTTTTTNSAKGPSNVVKTGDELKFMPYFIGMVVSGGLLLALMIYSIRRRKKEAEQK